MADEKKKEIEVNQTVHDGGPAFASLLQGERALRDEQPTPESGTPSLLADLRAKLAESDLALMKVSQDNDRLTRRNLELSRRDELGERSITLRDHDIEDWQTLMNAFARHSREAAELWETPATCLLRNPEASEITGLPTACFKHKASFEEVSESIGPVYDKHRRLLPPELWPLARALKGEAVEGVRLYMNDVLVEVRAYPVRLPWSPKRHALRFFHEVTR